VGENGDPRKEGNMEQGHLKESIFIGTEYLISQLEVNLSFVRLVPCMSRKESRIIITYSDPCSGPVLSLRT